MYLSCSSESYAPEINEGGLGLIDWFRLCAEELGLRAVELEDKHIGEPTAARIGELASAAARLGLQIVNIALMNNFGLADDGRRRAEEDRSIEWIGVSRDLGSRFLRTFAGWPEGDRAARWPAMIASLKAVCARAQASRMPLVMENHNHGGFVQTADDVAAIFDTVGSPALSLLLDTGNFLDGRPSIVRTARLAQHVHAKFTRVGVDGRDTRIDNAGAVDLLRAAGYRGAVSVEYEGEEPGRSAVPRALAHLRSLGLADTPV
ncbi:MAG TPA: sugar phosphate isomerase/epimerase family protein [bacterium]|nr:sugar phosphate isomerase/epimerase family protein [bacterium]